MAKSKKFVQNSKIDILKKMIIYCFCTKVKGRKPDTSSSNQKHDGKDGHWLETAMGITHNASNAPDISGFEMKNDTTSKTSFGDWSADYYIFKDEKYKINRDEFLEIFGAPNPKKEFRPSWSGRVCPKINGYNSSGQILSVDELNNILAIYSYEKDHRENKNEIVPINMRLQNLVLAKWNTASIKTKVENKFNKSGWFKCTKNSEGFYDQIVFGDPINFDTWINGVKNGLIFFDSGMYKGNTRNYSQWRASNAYWESLIRERY